MAEYIAEKIQILKDMGIYKTMTRKQRKYLKSMDNNHKVDRYIRDLICPPVQPENRVYKVWCGNV